MGVNEGSLQVIDIEVFEEIQNAPRPSEHPPVRGKNCQNVHPVREKNLQRCNKNINKTKKKQVW